MTPLEDKIIRHVYEILSQVSIPSPRGPIILDDDMSPEAKQALADQQLHEKIEKYGKCTRDLQDAMTWLQHLIEQAEAEKRIQADSLPSTVDTYPFTASAFEIMCDYACQDVIKSTPRNIIRTINECAIAAWDSEKKVIDDDIVNEIAPIIFG